MLRPLQCCVLNTYIPQNNWAFKIYFGGKNYVFAISQRRNSNKYSQLLLLKKSIILSKVFLLRCYSPDTWPKRKSFKHFSRYRYERLMREGKTTEAEQYLLVDPLDTSKYLSIQTFHDNAINPCMDSTFTFMEHLVREVNKLHENIQPLKIFHFGGDEVANG